MRNSIQCVLILCVAAIVLSDARLDAYSKRLLTKEDLANRPNQLHVVREEHLGNIFDTDQAVLYETLKEDKLVFNLLPSTNLIPRRIPALEWLSANYNGASLKNGARLSTMWFKLEPKQLDISFKPLFKSTGQFSAIIFPTIGSGNELVRIMTSNPDFNVKLINRSLPVTATDRVETVYFEWECRIPHAKEHVVTVYFFGKSDDVHAIYLMKVILSPIENELKLTNQAFDIKLDEGQAFRQILWLHNNHKSHIMVKNVFSSDNVKITHGWYISKERIQLDRDGEHLKVENMSPMDYWKIEPNNKMPISEVSFNLTRDSGQPSNSRYLSSAEVNVNIAQNLSNIDSVVSRNLTIPYKFYKKYFTQLVEEEFIELGIITSKDVVHRYSLMIENRFGKPAVIKRVSIEKKAIGMSLRVVTTFGYRVVIDPSMAPFELLSLITQPGEKSDFGYVSGAVHIELNVGGTTENITIPFEGGYYQDMLGSEDDMSFELKRHVKDDRVFNSLNGQFMNNFESDLVINNLTIIDVDTHKAAHGFTTVMKNKRLNRHDSSRAFMAQFNHTLNDFEPLTRKYELAQVNTFATTVSILLKYYTMNLMCGQHHIVSARYDKCKPLERVEFGYIALGHRKVITMDIYNPTMVSYIVKRVEFSTQSGNFELAFENQSRNGLKTYFKKVTQSISTFILFPKNEIVSLRFKVRPSTVGDFRETVTLFTNHGEFAFEILYKGIQGEILFTPSVLKYNLYYPIASDEHNVSANNKFGIDVKVNNPWSPQNFIYLNLKSEILKENTSKDPFLGVTLDMSDDEFININKPGYLKAGHQKYVTIADLASYKDQIRGWDKILREAKTEISGEVIVGTDLLGELKIQVKGSLKKAIFVPEEPLDYGALEEKRSHEVYVTIKNPTDREVSMYFYIADQAMLNFKRLEKKMQNKLKKKFSKYKQEQICIDHKGMDEEDMKYYAETLFDGVIVKSFDFLEDCIRRLCFVVNKAIEGHQKFFYDKGDYLFSATRHSRESKIKNMVDPYILEDIKKLSYRNPPHNHYTKYGMGFVEKIKLMAKRFRTLIRSRIKTPSPAKKKSSGKYISSVSKQNFLKIASKQDFYLNPKYRNKRVILGSGKSVSLSLLIFHSKESSAESKVNLLIKNDYSNLSILPITVQPGKIRMIVQKTSFPTDGGGTVIVNSKKEDYNKLIFSVNHGDLIIKFGTPMRKYDYKKVIKRKFELKNIGNIKIVVNKISVDNQGCSFGGFKIVNCLRFEIPPNGTYMLEINHEHPKNFDPDIRRTVSFIMQNRILTLDFEIRVTDPLVGEYSNRELNEAVTHINGIMIMIFVSILVVILFRRYKDKPVDLSTNVTDIEKNRFGSNLFFDNLFDLKLLEANVKIQKLEAQKNRQIRNIGIRELMVNNLIDANSRDVSINSGQIDADIERHPDEQPEAIYQEEDLIQDVDYRQRQKPGSKTKATGGRTVAKQIPNTPEPLAQQIDPEANYQGVKPKKKKTKKPQQVMQKTPLKQRDQDPDEQLLPTDNILDKIDEPLIYHKENLTPKYPNKPHVEYPEDDKPEREPIDASPSVQKPEEQRLENSNEVSHRSPQSQSNISRQKDAQSSDTAVKQEPGIQSIEPEAPARSKDVLKEAPNESSKPEIDEPTVPPVTQKTEKPAQSPSKDHYEPRKKGKQEQEPVYEAIAKQKDQPDRSKRGQEYRTSKDDDSEDYYKPKMMSPQDEDLKKKDSQTQQKADKDKNKGREKNRGRQEVYYQRKDRLPEEGENTEEYIPANISPLSKLNIKELEPSVAEPRLIQGQIEQSHHVEVAKPQIQLENPQSLPDFEESPGRFTPIINNQPNLQNRKGSQNKHSDWKQYQDQRRPQREGLSGDEGGDTDRNTSFDRFNQHISFHDGNISMIDNVEDVSNASHIHFLREQQEEGRANKGALETIEDSDDSEEDVQKSHERVRKLMEDTEEVQNEELLDESKDLTNKIVGVIGQKAKKTVKPLQANRQGGAVNAFIGFKQSQTQQKQFNQFNQFSPGDAQDLKPYHQAPYYGHPNHAQLPNAGVNYGPAYIHPNQPLAANTFGYGQKAGSNWYYQPPQGPNQNVNFQVHNNPYGSYVTRQTAAPAPVPVAHYGYQDPGYDSYGSGSENYETDENYYAHNRMVPDMKKAPPGLYADEQEQGEDYHAYRAPAYKQERSFTSNKPFKAAMNNPFTLSKLAGAKQENQPEEHYMGQPEEWQAPQEDYYGGNEDQEESNFSESFNKGGMRPPPGLTNEYEPVPEELNASQNKSKRSQNKSRTDPNVSQGEVSEGAQGSKLKFKKTRYNLFS